MRLSSTTHFSQSTVWIFTMCCSHSYLLTWSHLIPFLHLCIVITAVASYWHQQYAHFNSIKKPPVCARLYLHFHKIVSILINIVTVITSVTVVTAIHIVTLVMITTVTLVTTVTCSQCLPYCYISHYCLKSHYSHTNHFSHSRHYLP